MNSGGHSIGFHPITAFPFLGVTQSTAVSRSESAEGYIEAKTHLFLGDTARIACRWRILLPLC